MADERLGGAQLVVVEDEAAVAAEAATRVVAALGDAVAQRGAAHIALTGGSAAVPLYKELRKPFNRTAVDWTKVHLWWGDDRFVPIDHPASNAGVAYELLLDLSEKAGLSGEGGQYDDVAVGEIPGIDIDAENVHPINVDETLSDDEPVELAAELYLRELNRYVPLAKGGIPVFDVILLGIGPDGHTLSLFPGSPGLAPDAPIVLGVPAPEHVEPHIARVTLAARVLPAARAVIVMSAGEEKASVLAQVLGDDLDVARWPAQSALLPNAVWVLDRAAASMASVT
ncbi:MAG TPA: 6-phosphogluconolactonase [Candidatus Limnocylindrales bacterium]